VKRTPERASHVRATASRDHCRYVSFHGAGFSQHTGMLGDDQIKLEAAKRSDEVLRRLSAGAASGSAGSISLPQPSSELRPSAATSAVQRRGSFPLTMVPISLLPPRDGPKRPPVPRKR
jgi:hypothetical protein